MAEFPKVFPELMTNMVAAGEAGGILEIVMDRLAAQFEKDYRMNAKFKSAMIYPAIVLSVAAIVVAIIMMFVMPVFVGLFEQSLKSNFHLSPVSLSASAISLAITGIWLLPH